MFRLDAANQGGDHASHPQQVRRFIENAKSKMFEMHPALAIVLRVGSFAIWNISVSEEIDFHKVERQLPSKQSAPERTLEVSAGNSNRSPLVLKRPACHPEAAGDAVDASGELVAPQY